MNIKKEIDFFQLEKDIKKKLIQKNLKFHENRITPEISILLDEIGLISLNSEVEYSKFLGLSLLLTSTMFLYENVKENNKKINNDASTIIQETLRTTDTYKLCLETYNNYLDKYSALLKSFGINDSDEVAILYQYMLDRGLLSYNEQYHYEKTKITKKLSKYIGLYELDELTGCKVATGTGVCRHSSSQLTDIQNRVGNTSYNFYVEAIKNDFEIENYNEKIINHQYTIIKDDEQNYFGYCTTSKCFISLNFDFKDKYIYATSVPLIKGEKSYETIIPLDFNMLINANKEAVEDLLYRKRESYKDIDLILLTYKYTEIKNLIKCNERKLKEFYQNTKNDLLIISDCYKSIVPETGKIKQLKIR